MNVGVGFVKSQISTDANAGIGHGFVGVEVSNIDWRQARIPENRKIPETFNKWKC
jgi:hypothetical protein